MYDGYLSLAGVDVVNNPRTAAYAQALGLLDLSCDGCDLAAVLDDPPYGNPDTDPAPWYDPAVPESAGFAGWFALEVEGMSRSTLRRAPVPLLGGGAAISRPRFAHREMVWRVVGVAVDRCALAYGLAWLSSALRGGVCADCGGDTACVYTCCPTSDEQRRTLFEVGVLDGPAPVGAVRDLDAGCVSGDGVAVEVEFTLAAGRPWLWRDPLPVAEQVLFPTDSGCVEWVQGCEDRQAVADCAVPADCLEDPDSDCPKPPAPPLPPVPSDPCGQTCYDSVIADQVIITVPAEDMPQWLDSVPLLEVFTGSNPVRGLTVRFFPNPTGAPCTADRLDPCSACGTIAVPYLPPGATFTVDGRTQVAAVDCSAGRGQATVDATGAVFGPDGTVFQWPTFQCAGFCVAVSVQAGQELTDSTISLYVVSREDAI